MMQTLSWVVWPDLHNRKMTACNATRECMPANLTLLEFGVATVRLDVKESVW